MPKPTTCREPDLTALAKVFRQQSGRTRAEAARDLGVTRPTIQLAEENPEQSLTKLRIRIIQKYSAYKVTGPFYRLEKR